MKQPSLWEQLDPKSKRVVLNEHAQPGLCPRCMSMTWILWSRSGFLTKLDPEPIDFAGDLACYLAKRNTYRIWKSAKSFECDYRLPIDRQRWDGSGIVLAEHVCDRNNIRTALPNYWPTSTYTIPEEPPF